jgi:hypothetical protein
MVARVDVGQMIMAAIVKGAVVVAPCNILPRIWTAHPHVAFGLGLVVGVTLQHFIPPRGKPWQLCVLLALAVVAGFIAARL